MLSQDNMKHVLMNFLSSRVFILYVCVCDINWVKMCPGLGGHFAPMCGQDGPLS